ncbi:MAG: DUF2190 family protein [Candidatus Glassbacteria bacterium]|nr:DUF2190 family protein [Candidatus Glassbacteria bacterium]
MAIKLREKLNNVDTFTVGGSDIARGKCVVLNGGVLEASGANAAKFAGITTEVGYADRDVLVAGGGSVVLALAADGSIAEGDWLVSDADGKVDTADAASQGTVQYFVGYALKGSSAEDQLIPVVVWPMRVDNPAP